MSYAVRIKDHWAERRTFLVRSVVAAVVICSLLLTLVARLVDLQVLEHEHFADLSRGNRVRIEPMPPTRGLIMDRNGVVLAENLPAYQLELTPEQVVDVPATLQGLRALELIRPQDEDRIAQLLRSKRRFEAIPLRFQLSEAEVARFAVQRQAFPGVDIRARLRRSYPLGASTAHAIGYVGAISESDEQVIDLAAYAGTTHIGKIGVESSYEGDLHGTVGLRQVLVNAQGRVVEAQGRSAAQDIERRDPAPGRDLLLSIDIRVQQAAEAALGERRGAVVALDPANGDVLALVSMPSYDPNDFAAGISRDDYQALVQDPAKPLFNRALRGTYPPGSTVKPVMALAGLESHVARPDKQVLCHGSFRLPGSTHRYRDWKRGGHGVVDMRQAIVQSCDVYFYDLANELGIDRMHAFMSEFGLGVQTGIDVPGEKSGLMPSREWKRRNFAQRQDQVWFPGETVIAGIGQGYLLTTPLQLAHLAAVVGMRGERPRPRLVTGVRDPLDGTLRSVEVERPARIALAEEQFWDVAIDAMTGVMHDPRGTARASAAGAPYRMAGKTGTAQVFSIGQQERYDAEEIEEHLRDHGLFIAFAPADAPRIAVAVIVENGGSGSGAAAPVARKVIDAYLLEQTAPAAAGAR